MFRVARGKTRVGVLRGGPSGGYQMSLKTGQAVLQNLPDNYYGIDVFIDRDGVWHVEGIPRKPEKVLNGVEMVFNAMHGEYGEDGKVQRTLEAFGVPFNGSNSYHSSLSASKVSSKRIFKDHNIKTPFHVSVNENDISSARLFSIFDDFPKPMIVKPAFAGSSVGVSVVREGFEDFKKAINRALVYSPIVLVEEFIEGREAVCAVLDSSLDKSSYSLLPAEVILPDDSDFFEHSLKFDGLCQVECGRNFSDQEIEELQDLSFRVHKALGLRDYSVSDFVVSPRGIYLLEINSLPSLSESLPFVQSLKASGCELPELLEHLLVLASKR